MGRHPKHTGIYETRAELNSAVHDLRKGGMPPEEIAVRVGVPLHSVHYICSKMARTRNQRGDVVIARLGIKQVFAPSAIEEIIEAARYAGLSPSAHDALERIRLLLSFVEVRRKKGHDD